MSAEVRTCCGMDGTTGRGTQRACPSTTAEHGLGGGAVGEGNNCRGRNETQKKMPEANKHHGNRAF